MDDDEGVQFEMQAHDPYSVRSFSALEPQRCRLSHRAAGGPFRRLFYAAVRRCQALLDSHIHMFHFGGALPRPSGSAAAKLPSRSVRAAKRRASLWVRARIDRDPLGKRSGGSRARTVIVSVLRGARAGSAATRSGPPRTHRQGTRQCSASTPVSALRTPRPLRLHPIRRPRTPRSQSSLHDHRLP